MQNPFLTKRWTLVIYFISWIFVASIHCFVLMYFYHSNIRLAVTDSLVYSVLFSFAGLNLWYVVRFNSKDTIGWQNAIINHSVSALALIGLIGFLTFFIVSSIFVYAANYRVLFGISIYFRIISSIIYYFFLVLIYYIQLLYLEFQEQQLRQSQLQNMLKDAELTALKAQINPHFLFNSLNSASSLTMTNPEKAQDMIVKLSDFFRYSLTKSTSTEVRIEEEISNSMLYLEIEKVRFAEKLLIESNVELENKEIMVPALLLQPLFENAVKHGVYESLEPVTIHFDCVEKEDYILISIQNNYSEGSAKKGTGKGLKIVHDRLKIHFGENDLMQIHKTENSFEVKLKIPKNF